jgi:cell wall-associated NlpC family hydrolase
VDLAPADRRERLVAVAEQQLGVPYRCGGSDDRGFDCSGLVYYAHARVGIRVPRTAASQQRAAQHVPLHRLRAGDLLFFRIDGGKGDHVGIYQGDGRFIHAPSSGKRVSRGRLDNPYWRERLTAVGSYL